MATVEVKVPTLGESVTEATVGKMAQERRRCRRRRTSRSSSSRPTRSTLEVNAPVAGVIKRIKVAVGDTVEVGALIG